MGGLALYNNYKHKDTNPGVVATASTLAAGTSAASTTAAPTKNDNIIADNGGNQHDNTTKKNIPSSSNGIDFSSATKKDKGDGPDAKPKNPQGKSDNKIDSKNSISSSVDGVVAADHNEIANATIRHDTSAVGNGKAGAKQGYTAEITATPISNQNDNSEKENHGKADDGCNNNSNNNNGSTNRNDQADVDADIDDNISESSDEVEIIDVLVPYRPQTNFYENQNPAMLGLNEVTETSNPFEEGIFEF